MSIQKRSSILEYLLEKQGIILPTGIFEIETVTELERVLSTGNVYALRLFYEELAKKLSDVAMGRSKSVEVQRIREVFELLKNLQLDRNKPTEDDEKIIRFLVKNSILPAEDLIEMIGPFYYLLNVMKELENENIKSRTLRMFIFTSAYVQLYEMLLYQVDRRLYHYLSIHGYEYINDKQLKRFMENIDRSSTDHATAWEINKVLSKLLKMKTKNNSIFGNSALRRIRNAISHANLFYDPAEDVIFIGKNKLTVEQFLEEYCWMLRFTLRWLELSVGAEEGEDPVKVALLKMSSALRELSKVFLMIGRKSEYRKTFGAMVIQWKKEIQG